MERKDDVAGGRHRIEDNKWKNSEYSLLLVRPHPLMLTKLMRKEEKNVKLNHEIENANEKMCIYGYGYCHIESWG